MKEKIKVNKLRNEIAVYLLHNMKIPKGVKCHHNVGVSPVEDKVTIKLETFTLINNVPIVATTKINCISEKNSVKSEDFISKLDDYINQTLKYIDDALTSNKEEVEEA